MIGLIIFVVGVMFGFGEIFKEKKYKVGTVNKLGGMGMNNKMNTELNFTD